MRSLGHDMSIMRTENLRSYASMGSHRRHYGGVCLPGCVSRG